MTHLGSDKPWGIKWAHRDDPIFDLDFDVIETYPNGDKLPSMMISEPILDENENYNGRTFVMSYPFYTDIDGNDALYYGGCYYEEAMSYTSPENKKKRIECFQAAELLYRHSAGRGNPMANLCLGYIYSYDRCEGAYWRDPDTLETDEDYSRPYPTKERAFECLSIAAEAGIPEASYKLGDMYKHGIGCELNAEEAFKCYTRAAKLGEKEPPVILGSIALRLAGCYEEGFGCKQDFEQAFEWYKKAVDGLEFAVEHGQAWYEKALAGAHAGKKRCQQEISY